MKHLGYMVFFIYSVAFAQEPCAFNDTYFFAHTLDHQDSVEVCVSHDTLRYTASHKGEPEKTIIQELNRVKINKVLNGYELMVQQNETLYAIMDNDRRPSLLTVNNKRGIVFFTDLDNTHQFISRMYALSLAVEQLQKTTNVDFDT